ncbi:MAG: ACT domain-containing protein [Anaerolineales bacterium]
MEHHPGSLAFLSKALGEAEVNIRSLAGMLCADKGVIKLITSDVEATRAKLEEVHADFDQREILTVTMADRPGALGDFARVLWEANINIDTIYVLDTAGGYTELAIGVDKLEEAKQLPLAQY